MSATTQDRPSFGQEHFGRACLGDKRRTRSLVDLADRMARHPAGTLPQKLKDPNALRRCYDLVENPAVTHARVLQPHVQRTVERVQQQAGVVLNIHDGSELDFSSITSLHDQLGQIGTGSGKGYQAMNSLAVLPAQRQVLGLVSQILYKRPQVPKNESRAQKRDREDRESRLWLQAVNNVEQATQRCQPQRLSTDAGPLVVDVIDMGGDTFEFFDHEELLGRKYLVRSHHNREIRLGHEPGGAAAKLHEHLRTLPEQARYEAQLPDRPERPARKAELVVAWAAVLVLPPAKPRGKHRSVPLVAWGIRVWEPEPPAGVEAVEWFLLSNVEVVGVEHALERVKWYTIRWVVEEFHKAQKTGCDIESMQLMRAERLEPLIALLSVVATLLLDLRTASRDEEQKDRPATERVDFEYVQVLSGWRYKELRALTVEEFFLALARLGGHQNRRSDRRPGWLVLWRGWQSLQLMVEGARASQRAQPPAPPSPDTHGG